MIQINLDEEEKITLLQLLENCISDLRVEIGATDNMMYKEMLKNKKLVLLKLQDALQSAEQESIT